jgi:type IV pilus assembly protein PilX
MTARHAPSASRHRPASARRQRGIVLVTGMLFLVIITLLALTLFRGSGLLERIASSTRDKQRSFENAQSALQYGEWWLGLGNGGIGTPCSTLVSGSTVANVHVCTNALTSAAALPWSAGFTYAPPNYNVSTTGGQTASGDVNYYALPGFYIEYLGLSANLKSQLYRVTAYGYGGIAETGTVVRSTYQMTPKVVNLGGE